MKLIHWPSLLIGVGVAALIAILVNSFTALGFWPAFVVVVIAILINGAIATVEDELPGGFNNPQPAASLTLVAPQRWKLGVGMLSTVLRVLFGRRPPSLRSGGESALLNYSLELAQEWGDQWLKPIQDRLRKAYPSLSQSELDRLNSEAQAAMEYGHQLVYSMVEERGRDISESSWRETYLARYPWADERNLRHLFNTGQYYAWKDFG